MGDPFKKVQRGDRLRIPAETFNTFIDVARDYLGGRHRRQPGEGTESLQPGVVLVQNLSGAGRGRFEVLGIDQLLIDPVDNLPQFQNQPVLIGVTPLVEDHRGRFVVLLEPLAEGAIGRALLSGVTPVRLRMVQPTDPCAEVDDESPARLRSAASGAAQILWREPGEQAECWGLVRLGPFVRRPFFARLVDREGENLSPAFSWHEIEPVIGEEGPAWRDVDGGRSGAWNGAHPAYEVNGLRATLDENLQVLMWQEPDGRYYFDSAHTGYGNEQPDDRKVYQPVSDPHVDPPFLWEINAQPKQPDDPTRAHHGVVVLLKVKDPAVEGEEGELWIDAHFDTLGHLVRLDFPPDLSSSSESASGSSSASSSSLSSQSSSSQPSSSSSSGSVSASGSRVSSSLSTSVSGESGSGSAGISSVSTSVGSVSQSGGSGHDPSGSGTSQTPSSSTSGEGSGSAGGSSHLGSWGGSGSGSAGSSHSGSTGSGLSSVGSTGTSSSGSTGSASSGGSSGGVWNCQGWPAVTCDDCAPQPEGFIVSGDLGCLTIAEASVPKLPHLGCSWYAEPLNCNITIDPSGPALTPGGPPTLRLRLYVYAVDPPVEYEGLLCTCSQTSIVPIQGGGGDCAPAAELLITPYF
ncbi:MAG: hypothetical protein R3C01_10910 [Planctomycetaceae bacterium]